MLFRDTNLALVTFDGGVKSPMKTHLQAGKRYCADFFSRRTEESSFYSNGGLGLYFTVDTPSLVRPAGLPYEFAEKYTSAVKTAHERVLDTFWAPVSGSFTAQGNEKFMSIAPAYRRAQLSVDTLPPYYILNGAWGPQGYLIGVDEVFVYDCDCQRHFARDTLIRCGESLRLQSRYRTQDCRWENGDTHCVRTIYEAGEYILTAYLTDYEYTRIDTIRVQVQGEMQMAVSPQDTVICRGTSALLKAETTISPYRWNTGAAMQSLPVNESGIYYIQTPAGSCRQSDTARVQVIDCGRPDTSQAQGEYFFIPNAFTPDEARNKEFGMVQKEPLLSFEITIYNCWGNWVYQSRDPQFAWNGKDARNTPCPQGSYIYHIRCQPQSNPNIFEKWGKITLLR